MTEERFRWKPAPLRAAREVTLDADRVVMTGKDGWEVPLDSITGLAFMRVHMRGTFFRRLDLHTGTSVHQLPVNAPAVGRQTSPHADEHLRLVRAIAKALAARAPETPVMLGRVRRYRNVMLGIGLASLLGGLAIAALVFSTGISGDRLALAGVPVALMVLLGLALVRENGPWSRPKRIRAAEFPALLDRLAAEDVGFV